MTKHTRTLNIKRWGPSYHAYFGQRGNTAFRTQAVGQFDLETIERSVACWNAFHSSDGREIKTEKITEGLVWEMRDFIANMAEGGNFEARALLAKLED